MELIQHQCVGIDIAKATFTACVCRCANDHRIDFSEVALFQNNKQGFNQLLKWVRRKVTVQPKVIFIMEATGIYYEPLAYHLHQLQQLVSVMLPNKVKYYAKSLNIKSKTDIIDAQTIARLGTERLLPIWEPPAPVFKHLRDLTRLYTDLKGEKTAFVNRQQSVEAGNAPLPFVVRSTGAIIKKIDQEIAKCEQEMKKLIAGEDWLQEKVNKLQTIKGVGFITIAVILAETLGFRLINNSKQLVSYAGYDVVQRESGTSIKGKTRISKKGNGRLRAALHFPALAASRFNPQLRNVYLRINEKRSSKMIGAVALQRKLLVLMYSLWKNDTIYQERTTSGDQEAGALLRHPNKGKKTGRPTSLPAQDELPSNQSTEALLRRE